MSVTVRAAAAQHSRETVAVWRTAPDISVMALLETGSLGLAAMPEPGPPVEGLKPRLPSRLLSGWSSGRVGTYDRSHGPLSRHPI
ncbi:hypothetical protein EOD42_24120 [Rhodovarius crocodyli]|uniref:Uncharacterized protein n=1 Tax=Rhodovarius crocodyli TaxID=1979269 RepID=A0A437LX86_9PROT|nr:hypothetical protein [Rhodovarius crocodyli]RVT89983.1 hypothetical protein EOD42_24120 [Rhodovarius crocodyli]